MQGYICCSVKSKYTTPLTIACQAPLFIEFSRPEYWSGSPAPSPGDLPDPGIEPRSPALQADSLPSEPPGKITAPFKNITENFYIEVNWVIFFLFVIKIFHIP